VRIPDYSDILSGYGRLVVRNREMIRAERPHSRIRRKKFVLRPCYEAGIPKNLGE
jgi:hypothetical protein